jgi:Rho-binding antiterminator
LSDYQPIACGLHEQYQFAVMKHYWLDLVWKDEMDAKHSARVLPIDVFTRDKAEYLQIEINRNKVVDIRLDQILSACRALDGLALV